MIADSTIDYEQLNQVLIQEALCRPGFKLAARNQYDGPCPLPGCGADDNGFKIFTDGKPRFWCRQCNARGDLVDLFKKLNGCSDSELAQRYIGGDRVSGAKQGGGGHDTGVDIDWGVVPLAAEPVYNQSETSTIPSASATEDPATINGPAADERPARDPINRGSLGWVYAATRDPGNPYSTLWDHEARVQAHVAALRAYLTGQRSIPEAVIRQAVEANNLCAYDLWHSAHVNPSPPSPRRVMAALYRGTANQEPIVQLISMDGKPVWGEAHKPFPKKDQIRNRISNDGFFFAGAPWHEAQTVVLAEGVVTILSIAAAVPEACCIAIGSTSCVPKLAHIAKRADGKTVTAFFDAGPAGTEAAQKAAAIIPGLLSVTWPAGAKDNFDANDLLHQGHIDEIARMVREAKPVEIAGPSWKTPTVALDAIQQAFGRNEDGDAELFATLYRNALRYDHREARWFYFNPASGAWQKDILNVATAAVSRVADLYGGAVKHHSQRKLTATTEGNTDQAKSAAAREAQLLERISRLHTIKRKQAVLQLAAAGHGSLGIAGHEWDADPYLLGTQNGVVDLRTGEHRAGEPADYIRTTTGVEWRGLNEPCPTWERFLLDIAGGDEDLVAYEQRLLGYSLLGKTPEHIVPVFWGKGRNGKGTLFETLKHILGDYAYKAASELLLEQKNPRQSSAPDSATLALRGKRLVWCSETGEGRRINAAKLKELVGGDTLNARPLFGRDHIEFRPSHLLCLMTNFKPHAPANDYALWQRIHLIPFVVQYVAEPSGDYERKADPNLPDKLLAEGSGILAWLVRGCQAYQKDGLQVPDTVKAATAEYRADEDTLGHFIAECCDVCETADGKAGEIYKGYRQWCDRSGHRPMSGVAFGKEMRLRYDAYGERNVFYTGIDLNQETKNELRKGE